MENIFTLGKLLHLWFCFLLHSILFFYISNLLSYIQNNFSYELARPIMGTIFLVGERAKRARHSQVCSIENRIYITRKMVPIPRRASSFLVVFIHVNRKEEEEGETEQQQQFTKGCNILTDSFHPNLYHTQ